MDWAVLDKHIITMEPKKALSDKVDIYKKGYALMTHPFGNI
jgi:hypothetical protein